MNFKRKIFNLFAAVVMIFGSVPISFTNTYADEGDSASNVPEHSKTVTPNGDGTYNITLSVTGKQSSEASVSKANVVVVFDTSNSMEYGTSCTRDYSYNNNDTDQYGFVDGNYVPLYRRNGAWRYGNAETRYDGEHYNCASDRLTVAQGATTNLISKLLANNSLEGADSDTVEISLVNFATGVRSTTNWSTNETTLNNAVNGYDVPRSAQGGTNWETALSSAKTLVNNRISSQPGESNYVIFVSDGDPTFRDSQMGSNNAGYYGSDWNSTVNKWGTGNSDPNSWNFDAAKDVADSIAGLANTTLYTVGAFGDADVMESLAGSDHYYDASNQQALENAFSQIVDQITDALSLTNIKFTDGITALTTAAVSGNPDNFTYTKGGTAWIDAPEAEVKTIDGTKTVVWDLGDTTLKDGETATVSFTVWPSQASYDILADLNNGKISYDSLTDAQKASIVKDDNSYSLQTNTEWPTLTYSTVETVTVNGVPTTTVSDPTTIEIKNDGPMPLETRKLTLEKKWEDSLDPSQREEVEEVVLDFYKDGDKYEGDIHLNEENNWKLPDYISIAPGVMISNESSNYNLLKAGHTEYSFGGKKYIILETGHDYYFEEEDINSHFELTNYTYHPMIIDNVLKNVVFTHNIDGDITGIEEFKNMESVSATNTLKGGINIEKKVVDKNGNAVDTDDSFKITAHLIDADGKPYEYDYRIYYGEKNPEYESHIVYNGDGSVRYSRSNHIYGTGDLTETLYIGDVIRIVNVESGVEYYVEEDVKDGYAPNPVITYEEKYGDENNSSPSTSTADGYYVVSGNTASSVTITNKFLDEKTKVDFEKTWYDEDGNVLSGEDLPGSITIELFKKGANGKTVSTGKTKQVTAGTDWKGSFTDLPKYDNGVEIVYSIEESAIDGATYDDEQKAFFEFDAEENNGKHAVLGRWKVMTLEDYILQNTWTPATENVTGKTSFNIVKVDKTTGEPLSDVTFELKLKDGATFTATTDADGKATFDNLNSGEYTLKESVAPEGYKIISAQPNIKITSIKKLNNVDLDNLTNFYEYVFSFGVSSQMDGYEYDAESRTFTVENEPIPYGDIVAAKVWDDGEDRDGLRKNYTNYYVAVKNNSGKYVAYERLMLEDKADYEFTHLPEKTADGEDIQYEIVEASTCSGTGDAIRCTEFDGDDDYTVTIEDNVITNHHKPATTEDLTVQKIWNGKGNELVRPNTITIELYGEITNSEGEREKWMVGEPVVISAANEWKWTFTGLFENKDGKKITYSVEESKLGETGFGEDESIIVVYEKDGETLKGRWEKAIDEYEVTNTWTEPTEEIEFEGEDEFYIKKYDGDGKEMQGVVFTVGGDDYTTDKNGEIKISLPLNDEKKEESFSYVISEKSTHDGYDLAEGSATVTVSCTSKFAGSDANKLINTYTKTCEFMEDGAEAFEWNGATRTVKVINNRSLAASLVIRKETAGITGQALRDNGLKFTVTGPADFETQEITFDKFTKIKDGVYEYALPGKIPTGEYTVVESGAEFDGLLTLTVTGDNDVAKDVEKAAEAKFTIKNTYEKIRDVHYKVAKVWDDDDDRDGVRPDDLEVTLLRNGEAYRTTTLKADDWAYEWTNLPRADENATEYVYTVVEEDLDDYKSDGGKMMDGVFTFTNTHEPETKELKFKKVWNVNGNVLPSVAPTFITVELSNDKNAEKKTIRLDGTGYGEWESDAITVLVYANHGEEITYSVKETDINGDALTGINGDTLYIYNGDLLEGKWVAENTDALTVENTWTPVEEKIVYEGEKEFTLKKVDDDGEVMQGVAFEVNGEEYVTDENGEITIEVPLSSDQKEESFEYEIKEVDTWYGYDLVEDSATVTVTCASEFSKADESTLTNTFVKNCEFVKEGAEEFVWNGVDLSMTVVNNRSKAGSLTVVKVFSGIDEAKLKDLTFIVVGPEDFGDNGELTLSFANDCEISDGVAICPVEAEIPVGEYMVVEENAEVDNYALTSHGDGEMMEVLRDDEAVFVIENEYEIIDPCLEGGCGGDTIPPVTPETGRLAIAEKAQNEQSVTADNMIVFTVLVGVCTVILYGAAKFAKKQK